MKKPLPLPCDFSGFFLQFNKESKMVQKQLHYMFKLESLSSNTTFTTFIAIRIRLALLSYTREDFIQKISRLAQFTKNTFNNSHSTFITQLNKVTKFPERHNIQILFPKLDISSIRVIRFTETSFENNVNR